VVGGTFQVKALRLRLDPFRCACQGFHKEPSTQKPDQQTPIGFPQRVINQKARPANTNRVSIKSHQPKNPISECRPGFHKESSTKKPDQQTPIGFPQRVINQETRPANADRVSIKSHQPRNPTSKHQSGFDKESSTKKPDQRMLIGFQ
jgi:hypothetical protein